MNKLILAILAMILLAGCDPNYQNAKSTNAPYSRDIEIDTISIHGNKHEVLFWNDRSCGGMMHSPECWCKKGGEK